MWLWGKDESSNTLFQTSLVMEFWSNKTIVIDINLFSTFQIVIKLHGEEVFT